MVSYTCDIMYYAEVKTIGGKTSARSINKYQRAHYARIQIDIKKELAEKFEQKLKQDGIQKTEFIRSKIIEYVGETE